MIDPGSRRKGLGIRHRCVRNALRCKDVFADPYFGEDELQPGEMQLRSFYSPGLQPGHYTINANQHVEVPNENPIKLNAKADFIVPDVSHTPLDPGTINSTFPPTGIAAEHHILPHVVFNDPHLPWQMMLDEEGNPSQTLDEAPTGIPWLAVIVFDQDEQRTGSGPPPQPVIVKPGPDAKPEENWNFVFIKKELFQALFTDSKPTPAPINLSRYKYLAHVREVNIDHMTDIRNTIEGLDTGTFSVVLSHRTGPFLDEGSDPKPCVAHVIALDQVRNYASMSTEDDVALVSLFSWTYDCLPPNVINFKDTFTHLGHNFKSFQPPSEIIDQVDQSSPIRDRLEQGYTLVRYRVQTGEETVALMRGPLIPSGFNDDDESEWFSVTSNTGEDLQIIEKSLGLVDLSYCAAWQIGKALAIADQAFSRALLKIRGYVHNASSAKRKEDNMRKAYYQDNTLEAVVNRLEGMIGTLVGKGELKWDKDAEGDETRYKRDPLVQTRYETSWNSFAGHRIDISLLDDYLGGITSAVDALDGSSSHYTELNDPDNPDWKLVLTFLMDLIFLKGVPPYYLIPDPTWLPSESIRFFYVDKKWLSALVDGALSVCNHLDRNDATRAAIKEELLKYIKSDLHEGVGYSPQLPRYGFYLRSVAVNAFPDLVIRAPLHNEKDKRAEILRQERVGNGVIFCLFDRTPTDTGDDQLEEVKFSQPPHQQCFSFCDDSLKKDTLTMNIRGVKNYANGKMDPITTDERKRVNDQCDVYNWKWRTIDLDGFDDAIIKAFETQTDLYKPKDGKANSALIGIELNNPIYQLRFTSKTPRVSSSDVFSLLEAPASFGVPTSFPVPASLTQMSLPVVPASFGVPTSFAVPTSFTQISLPVVPASSTQSILTSSPVFVFTAYCYTLGRVDIPKRNRLQYKKGGTDVLFVLKRKKNLPNGVDLDDYIERITLAIPNVLFKMKDGNVRVPGKHDARMVRNIRLLPVVRQEGKETTIVELIPKTHDADADAPLTTLLQNNEDLSFILAAHVTDDTDLKNVIIQVTETYSTYGEAPNTIKVLEIQPEDPTHG